jgi:hypothetical protein
MLLPRRDLELESSLEPQQIYQALAPHVGPAPPLGTRAYKPYAGSVNLASFDLRPNITYRNSFLPFAVGRVWPVASGSRVVVTMRMGTVTRVFMTLWLLMASGFIVLTSGMAIITGVLHGERGGLVVFGGLTLFLLMFPLAGLAMARKGFRREAEPLEKFLRDVLRAPPAPPYR